MIVRVVVTAGVVSVVTVVIVTVVTVAIVTSFSKKQLDTLTTDGMFSGQHFAILAMFWRLVLVSCSSSLGLCLLVLYLCLVLLD